MIWKILTVILAVSVAVLIAVLVKIRAQLRDINEQLDFLCEKDTNMLLLTDTAAISMDPREGTSWE